MFVFGPHTTPDKFKTQQPSVILYLCLTKTRLGNSHDYRNCIVFEKFRFQNIFRPHENKKPAFSNCSSLKTIFEKLRFRDRFGVDGRPNRRNKAAFSNLSGEVGRCLKIPWLQSDIIVKAFLKSEFAPIIDQVL